MEKKTNQQKLRPATAKAEASHIFVRAELTLSPERRLRMRMCP